MDAERWHSTRDECLSRVIAELVGDAADASFDQDPGNADAGRVRLTSRQDSRREVGIRAATHWSDITVFDLGVSGTFFHEDASLEDMEKDLRALALVAHDYLVGRGTIELKRNWLRRRRPRLSITTIHGVTELGPRWSWSSLAHPDY